jgi:hypothetical protein
MIREFCCGFYAEHGGVVMKRVLLCAALVIATVQFASAAPELLLKTGANTVQVIGVPGSVSFASANFGGWNLMVIFGASSSPGLSPFGVDLTSLTAECVGGGSCDDLHVWMSDTGFTQTAGGFTNSFSSTQTGAGASATAQAWVGLGNNFFESDGSDGLPTVAGGSLIGSVGSFDGAGAFAGSASASIPAGPGPYSLTIKDTFKGCSGAASCSYSVDGSITAVPEPAYLSMLGTLMSLGGLALRRRKL